jgi:ring-1,2-phenylacetyl-CoA epoxidase subunit PaaD
VPVLSVRELGVLRDVEVTADGVVVVMTPTYTGCPAMHAMEAEVLRTLEQHGVPNARVRTVYSPAWTTDWLSTEAKAKLAAYGIAPPGPVDTDLVPLLRRATVECPYCHSPNTTLRSEFGSTACKAILFCNSCSQPFELFKAI